MIKKTPQPTRIMNVGMFSIEVHRCEILGPRGGHRGWSKTTIAVNITHSGIKVNGSEDLTLLSCRYEWNRVRDQGELIDHITDLASSLSHIWNSPNVHDLLTITQRLIEDLPDA